MPWLIAFGPLLLLSPSEAFADPSAPRVVNYQGKSAAEIGWVADRVCFDRAHARHAHWSSEPRMTRKALDFVGGRNHFNELMHCLLTEGTQRYCSATERRMIVAEIAKYFGVIAYHNQDIEQWLKGGARDYMRPLQTSGIDPDPPVIVAIASRLRDGLLTQADRDEIAAAAPPEIRERLARIDPPRPNCPDEPWWAFWR